MRVVATLLTLATLLPAAEPLRQRVDGAAPLRFLLERALVDGLAASKPGSLLLDPKAKPALDHILAQLALLEQDRGVPPLVATATGAQGLLLLGYGQEGPMRSPWSEPSMLVLFDTGAAQAAWSTYWQKNITGGTSASVAGITGTLQRRNFSAMAGDRLWAGTLTAAKHQEALGAAPALSTAPLQLHIDASGLPAALAASLGKAERGVTDRILPVWDAWTPVGDVVTRLDGDVLVTSATVSGMKGVPLHAVDPRLASLLRADQQIVLLAGLEPKTLALTIGLVLNEGNDREDPDAALVAALGSDSTALAAAFTGDLAVHGGWQAGPIPLFAAALGTTAQAEAVVTAAAAALGWEEAPVAGATHSWNVFTPAGVLVVALTADRLILGTEPTLVDTMVAGTPGTLKAEPGAAIDLRIDAPAVAKQWLPLAWGMLSAQKQVLGQDPLSVFSHLGYQVAQRSDFDGSPITTSELVLSKDRGGRHWFTASLARLWPEGVPAGLDAGVTVLRKTAEPADTPADPNTVPMPNAGPGNAEAIFVLRTAAGWILANQDRRADRPAMDAATLATRLTGYTRIAGPEVADLAVTTLPVLATFDRRWLPPLPVVLAHIPPHRLWVKASGGVLTAQERGLPLVGTLAYAGGIGAWAAQWQFGSQERWQRYTAEQQQVRERHPDAIAAFEAAQQALKSRRGDDHQGGAMTKDDIPAKASLLVTENNLDLTELTALNGGKALANATALDAIGRWNPTPGDDWPQYVWAVRLEGDWCLTLSIWGQVDVTTGLDDIPAIPAVKAGGGEALF